MDININDFFFIEYCLELDKQRLTLFIFCYSHPVQFQLHTRQLQQQYHTSSTPAGFIFFFWSDDFDVNVAVEHKAKPFMIPSQTMKANFN